MHLFSFQNRVPTNVVNKIGQANIEFSPFDSYRAKRNSVHGAGHKAEYVLNPAAGFGLHYNVKRRFPCIAFSALCGTHFQVTGEIIQRKMATVFSLYSSDYSGFSQQPNI